MQLDAELNSEVALKKRPTPLGLLTSSLYHFSTDIKFAHSVFALPFAAVGVLVGQLALPSLPQIGLAVGCMVTARTFAMGMNRFFDHRLDAENPRTANRSIPSGKLTPRAAVVWSLFSGVVFVVLARFLSPLAGWLALPLLVILAVYSLMKRISWLTHWYLGLCLGLAPIAVNIAFGGYVSLAVLMLGAAVMFWTAGFDIIYSLQDRQFDSLKGFKSVPAAFGAAKALWISRLSFVAMIAFLVATGILASTGIYYFLGVALVAGILTYEHFLVRHIAVNPEGVRISAAFFTANAWVSVLFYVFVQWDYLVR